MRLLLATTLLMLPVALGAATADPHGSFDCQDLSLVPMDFSVDYETEVQPIFTGSCANCHVSSPFPDAGLRLDPGKSYNDLVNVPSVQDGTLLRVKPFDASQSVLFSKVNCDGPLVGLRMPLDRSPLTPEAQALIMDWINQGALPVPAVPDLLTRADFETRG